MPQNAPSPAIQQALALTSQRLQAGDLAGAEAALSPFFTPALPSDPVLLNAAGVLRLAQGRFADAAHLCGLAANAAPREAMFVFNQGRALATLGETGAAEQAFRAAVKSRPDFVDALFELGSLLHRSARPHEAQKAFRALLRAAPGHVPAKLMLGAALVDSGQPQDAEVPLRRGIAEATDPRLKAVLHHNLGLALRRQRKDQEALGAYDAAQALDPNLENLAVHRGEALQNLSRHEEALAVFEAALEKDSANPELHHRANDLLYRLGREDFLTSYNRAPNSRALKLGKAFFLSHAKRGAEAHEVYESLLARDAGDREAQLGAANALTMMGRHADASAAFDALLANGADADLFSCAAEPAILGGDAQRALMLCEQGLAHTPYDQGCLALKSVALRMMDDERDEALNGYDTLVREFYLEPPEGFSSMADFNAELNGALDSMHPDTREFINQSLRGGTQTPDQLFENALPLVAGLRRRIDEAMARYIAELTLNGADNEAHPFLSRRARDFRYAGSWSSRLRDRGFHVNHIHHQGWISSCYYVAVPDAAKDEQARQGWIKFGESSFDVALKNPVRRAIQPAAGKLVLFPSYMWHGTVPFHDTAARTTIAFDVVPD